MTVRTYDFTERLGPAKRDHDRSKGAKSQVSDLAVSPRMDRARSPKPFSRNEKGHP